MLDLHPGCHERGLPLYQRREGKEDLNFGMTQIIHCLIFLGSDGNSNIIDNVGVTDSTVTNSSSLSVYERKH
jgi:hypothetical protein